MCFVVFEDVLLKVLDGPLSSVSCMESHRCESGMVWDVGVHVVHWPRYGPDYVPFWLACPLVHFCQS